MSYIAPGLAKGCFMMDDLRLSTLECFYADSQCFENLLTAINITFHRYFPLNAPQLTVRPLSIDGTTTTHFNTKTRLFDIIDAMMIETWASSVSFDTYYQTCQPTSCTYLQTTHETSLMHLLISLVSLIGGLSAAVRLIASITIKLLFRFLRRKENLSDQTVRRGVFDRLSSMTRKVNLVVSTKLGLLNIFPTRTFPHHLPPETATRLGRWGTRLYFLLLLISIIVLAFHTLIRPQTLIKTFTKPSFDLYRRLVDQHGVENLRCPCSVISSSYSEYVNIAPLFHQVR